MMTLRYSIVIVLSLPVLALGIVADIIKFPFLLFFVWPLWAFFDLISVLKGEESVLLEMMWETAFMGVIMWWDMVS